MTGGSVVPDTDAAPDPAPAIRARRRLPLVWLVPLVAVAIAGWLGWTTLRERGPLITIHFETGEGLEAGKTRIKHKDVELGIVQGVELAADLSHVSVTAQMSRAAAAHLRENTRFWVVKPRIGAGGVSGLGTLLSGAYIELDPGSGERRNDFVGLEEPPVVRSGAAGRSFTLHGDRLGSIEPGAPVFYRDIAVGEVQRIRFGEMAETVDVQVFVRAPYDEFVYDGSRFWRASGISVTTGPNGVHLELESLRALLSGGIAFDTPIQARSGERATAGREFVLHADREAASAVSYRRSEPLLAYFEGSVRGLGIGSPVEWFGIQVGRVLDVKLEFDPASGRVRVPVLFEIEPERVANAGQNTTDQQLERLRMLVAHGMRAQLRSNNLLTGQLAVALEIFPDAPPASVERIGDRYVVPTVPTQIETLTRSLSEVVEKLGSVPFDEIGRNLNETLASLRAMAGSTQVADSLQSLQRTMAAVEDLARSADRNMTPALQRLPAIAQTLQQAITRLNSVAGSVESGYGQSSQFNRDMTRLVAQLNDAARSIRLLADYVERHPEALVRGKAERATERGR